MPKVMPFSELPAADLFIDAVYEGGSAGNVGDDPTRRDIAEILIKNGFNIKERVETLLRDEFKV